jgi:hypothetical protein
MTFKLNKLGRDLVDIIEMKIHQEQSYNPSGKKTSRLTLLDWFNES